MLPSVVINNRSPLFHGDINLYNNGPDLPVVISELQKYVNRVHDVLNERCVHLNASKNEIMILHRSPVDLNQHTLKVGNSTVSPCSSAKYLGLTIDTRLTSSHHIDLLVGKIAGKLKTFQRVRNSQDNRARRSFYISLIQTSLLDGSYALSPCLSITHVNRLITITKRAQRISFGYPPSAHAARIRARHNLIPLDSLLLFKGLLVVFRSLHSLGSCLLDSLSLPTPQCLKNRIHDPPSLTSRPQPCTIHSQFATPLCHLAPVPSTWDRRSITASRFPVTLIY